MFLIDSRWCLGYNKRKGIIIVIEREVDRMKRSSGKRASWKTKKRMAEVLCVVVVVLSMTLSLYFQTSNDTDYKKDISLAQQSAQAKVVNYGNSATLRMDTSTIENGAERGTAVREESAATFSNNSGNSDGVRRNHVVNNMLSVGTNAPNQVVKNPPTFSLVSGIFENHGTEPEWAGADMLYQYPVELGYPVDNNYDGKQTEKGIIQDYVFKPAEDELYSDNREEEQTDESGEPVTEETEDSDMEEVTKEESVKEETATEEPVTEEATTEDEAEEKVVGDSADGAQDGEEAAQADEEKKAAPKKDKEFQKRIQKTMFPTKPVQVNMPVKNVKKAVDYTQKRLKASKYSSRLNLKTSINALLGEGNVKDDTEAPDEEKNTEGSAEAPDEGKNTEGSAETPDEGKNTEGSAETPDEGKNTESSTETPVNEENVENNTEASVGEENVKNDTEAPIDGDDIEQVSEDGRIQADSSFFVVSGKMRVDSQVFVSDIKVKPTGKDGFNKVRIGREGDFQSSVTLTEDASEKEVTLYFSDGANETAGVTFAYSKDTSNPSMSFNGAYFNVLRGGGTNIYCTNNAELELVLEDGSNGTGVDKICYVYGDRVADFTNITGGAKAALTQDFYGKIFMNCADKAGNTSPVLSEYILLDRVTPKIEFSQDEYCSTPYTLWIDVADSGSIVSGLASVVCTVNGEPIEIANLESRGAVKLADDLEVPQTVGFSIPFETEGEFSIQVIATDYAGNTTVEERNITVAKPEFVSVFMPETFTIHIDPQRLLERESIFSDNIELTNVSEFDVRVTVDSIELYVNDEVSPEGIEKDCDIYFVTPDTGEKIKLEKGENKDVYSYCLPVNAEGDIANLSFVGSTTEGSDKMWQDSDISIVVNLSFRKWRGK